MTSNGSANSTEYRGARLLAKYDFVRTAKAVTMELYSSADEYFARCKGRTGSLVVVRECRWSKLPWIRRGGRASRKWPRSFKSADGMVRSICELIGGLNQPPRLRPLRRLRNILLMGAATPP